MMSDQNEKIKIINQLLISFKGRETDLVNYIIYSINNNYSHDVVRNIRQTLIGVTDLTKINKFLEMWLKNLDYSMLKIIKDDDSKLNIFININEIKNIIKDRRNLLILKKLTQQNDHFIHYNLNFSLDELCINDFLNIQKIILEKSSKELVLKDINYRYSTLINHNKNLKKYMISEDFLIWAYQYLKKKNMLMDPATTHIGYLESINLYFDLIYFNDALLYEVKIDSIKKAWRQKQFRDQGKTKKEYHLPLTKQAKDELSNLAKFNNLSENSMLEKLIHQAYLSEMCDEKGKQKF